MFLIWMQNGGVKRKQFTTTKPSIIQARDLPEAAPELVEA
jgi:hypothetical protein